MIIFKSAGDLAGWIKEQQNAKRPIGFVPTMGALHAGHISLIDISKKATGVTVCSIFVNPTQFNDPKDFQKYPITIEKDIYMLEKAGTDALFLPEVDELYPGGTTNLEKYDLGYLEEILEGKYRPGHFQGVCQVVRRLLDIVKPDTLFMGQKDYQQCMVVGRLLEITGSAVRLHPCPIVREPDGLAMSSRNVRLSAIQRKNATAIFQALNLLKEAGLVNGANDDEEGDGVNGANEGKGASVEPIRGKREETLSKARQFLERHGFRIDYVELADAKTLKPLQDENSKQVIALIAAFQEEVRLIDNMML